MTRATFYQSGIGLLVSLGVASCASGPRVALVPGSDPQPQLAATENRLKADKANQFDLLSPQHFESAQMAVTSARKRSENSDASDKVLEDVGKAMGELAVVEKNAQANVALFATVLTARASAKTLNAETILPKEFDSADRDLKSFGEAIENQEFTADASKISELEGRYTELQLSALKKTQLGEANALIEKADQNGAQSDAPTTYAEAQVQYDSAARAIETNRNNPEAFRPVVATAVRLAQKLTRVLKTMSETKASEAAAVKIYDQEQQLAANQVSLQGAQADRQTLQVVENQNQQYASKEAAEKRIEFLKSEFEPSEATILRDGNKIIVRLKTMKFSPARFELTSSSLDTLQKVKEMIHALNVKQVVVEGHTDSVGGEEKNLELSQKRANAVKKYFVSAKTLTSDKVVAKGFGDGKPVATNKTKVGRAINRRVDVVIETVTTL